MTSYLLTWNPRRSGYWDELEWLAKKKRGRWSCGSRRVMPKGSRVYLFRQGAEPKGIVASGFTISDVYPDKHWDAKRRRRGVKANYVDVRFDVVLRDACFPAHQLRSLRSVYWRTQMSGIQIPRAAALELERRWALFARLGRRVELKREVAAMENTVTEVRAYVRTRDRSLRERALSDSGGICAACRIDFGAMLDGLGRRVLQVHHRRQLAASDTPRLTKLSDLAVVCANCHSLIHSNPSRAIAVKALRRMLRA